MLDFNAGEILLLVVLAVIIFGPEKLPELARKAARVVTYLRGVANDAQKQLREQVPELGDLDLTDLNPRSLGVKLLGAATVDDLSETRRTVSREVSEVAGQAVEAGGQAELATGSQAAAGSSQAPAAGTVEASSDRIVAFDTEAT